MCQLSNNDFLGQIFRESFHLKLGNFYWDTLYVIYFLNWPKKLVFLSFQTVEIKVSAKVNDTSSSRYIKTLRSFKMKSQRYAKPSACTVLCLKDKMQTIFFAH